MPETSPPNPSDEQKPSSVDSDDNPTAIIPSVAAPPKDLSDEEWALIESLRGNQDPSPDSPGPEIDGLAAGSETATNSTADFSGEKTKNRSKIIIIGIAAIVILAGFVGFFGVKKMGGENPSAEPQAEQTTSAAATPGERLIDGHIDPIQLSPEQISDLDSLNSIGLVNVYAKTAIPALQETLDELYVNPDVDLSVITSSPQVMATLRQMGDYFRDLGESNLKIYLSSTVPTNVKGEFNFSNTATSLLGQDDGAMLRVATVSDDDPVALNESSNTRWNTSIVPVVSGDHLEFASTKN